MEVSNWSIAVASWRGENCPRDQSARVCGAWSLRSKGTQRLRQDTRGEEWEVRSEKSFGRQSKSRAAWRAPSAGRRTPVSLRYAPASLRPARCAPRMDKNKDSQQRDILS
jgi:hypothetical protein